MGISIPSFLKDMGPDFLAYTLNLSEEDAKGILNGSHDTDPIRLMVLEGLIKHCSRIRQEAIDTNAIEINLVLNLQSWVYNNKHQFNIWREQFGGKKPHITTDDPLLKVLSQIALEAYPLLLIKTNQSSHFIELSMCGLINNLPDSHLLLTELKNDSSIKKLLHTTIANNRLTYKKLSLRSHSNYVLEAMPSHLLRNILILYKLRGSLSVESLLQTIEITIHILRKIADGKLVYAPLLIGFNNLGLNPTSEINLSIGKIFAYQKSSFYLLSDRARPSDISLGIILESKWNISDTLESEIVKETYLVTDRDSLGLNEKLSLAIALATDRNPPVGIKLSWSYHFDPLAENPDYLIHLHPKSSMPLYILESEDEIKINYWLDLINNADNSHIQIAIQRLILSMNERDNPIDGFIDAVISLENLLGGHAELSYRISIAAAKLLESSLKKREELQKQVKFLYEERSKIVHGTKVLTFEDAEKRWHESVSLVLRILRELYSNYPELLANKERSKILALL